MRAIWIGPNPFKFTSKITFKPFEVIEFDPKWLRMMRARGVRHRLLEADLVRRQLAAGKYRDSEVMRFARLAFGVEDAAKIESVADATALLMDHLYDAKARPVLDEKPKAPKVNLVASENEPETEAEPETEWTTAAERAAIVRGLSEAGETIAQIAEAVGVSASTVRKDLKRAE